MFDVKNDCKNKSIEEFRHSFKKNEKLPILHIKVIFFSLTFSRKEEWNLKAGAMGVGGVGGGLIVYLYASKENFA